MAENKKKVNAEKPSSSEEKKPLTKAASTTKKSPATKASPKKATPKKTTSAKTKSSSEKTTVAKVAPKKTGAKKATVTKAPKAATTKTSEAKKAPLKAEKGTKTKKARVNVESATSAKTSPKKIVKVNVDQKAVVAAAKKDLKVLATAKNELKSKIFNLEKKYDQAIFDSILSERASRRQGTHKTKNRAEVSGTGKKPFAQKGTGNARAGTLRAPHHVGGGVARGVHNNRNYNLKVNKKVKKLALKASLTNLAQQNGVLIKDMAMETISTKSLLNMLEEHNANFLKHILIVSDNKNLFLSARNLKNIKVTKVTSLQVEDLSLAHLLILDAKDVKTLEGVLA